MGDIKWFFPKDAGEAVNIISSEADAVFHAGGTGLLRRGFSGISVFVDLHKAELDFFERSDVEVEIGAMRSYNDIAFDIEKSKTAPFLAEAVRSLPASLGNRITVGGSVALFAPWCDAMGPLLAMDAKVILHGANSGVFSLSDYAGNKKLKEKTLLASIRFNPDGWEGAYARWTRTHFDYPAFTTTVSVKKMDGKINDARVIIVGCNGGFVRLSSVESEMIGMDVAEIDVSNLVSKNFSAEFYKKPHGSADYLKHAASVTVERLISQLINKG